MATNDFLPFGGDGAANVISQAVYAALAQRMTGFQSGVAQSAQLNKVWRQSSIMAAVLAQFIADSTGQNSVDDGTTATLLANLKRAAAGFNGSLSLNTSTSLTAAGAGAVIYYFGSTAGQTLTLPAAASLAPGQTYTFTNFASVPVTVARSGSDTILVGAGVGSIVLQPGDDLEMAVVNTSQWVATGSAARQFAPLVVGAGTQAAHAAQVAQAGFQNQAIYRRSGGVQQVSINGGAFTTTGATSFPAPVSGRARVRLWAGGGGGGGSSGGAGALSGGGGAGGYNEFLVTGLSTATAVTVGAGGVGGATGTTAGSQGGASSFGAIGSAFGGTGGQPQAGAGSAAGGVGAGGSGGALIVTGQNGGSGFGQINSAYQLAAGGGSFGSSVTQGPIASGANAGFSGTFPAGGASGSQSSSGSGGADGLVIVDY